MQRMKALLHQVALAVASLGLATSRGSVVAFTLTTAVAARTKSTPLNTGIHQRQSSSTCLHAKLKFKSFEGMLGELQTEPLLLVYFYKELCGPCKLQRRELNVIASRLPKILAIDVEKWPNVGTRHKVGSLPCLLMIRQGQEVDRMEGLTLSDDLLDRVTAFRQLAR